MNLLRPYGKIYAAFLLILLSFASDWRLNMSSALTLSKSMYSLHNKIAPLEMTTSSSLPVGGVDANNADDLTKLKFHMSSIKVAVPFVASLLNSSQPLDSWIKPLNKFRPAEICALLVGCVGVRLEWGTMESVMDQLVKNGMLTSELLYICIHSSISRNVWYVGYYSLLKISKWNHYIKWSNNRPKYLSTDMETVNGVIGMLLRNKKLNESLSIMRVVHEGKLGTDIVCDLEMFSQIALHATFHGHHELMVEILRAIEKKNPRLQGREKIFMSCLTMCMYQQNISAAFDVYSSYKNSVRIVDEKVYAQLLLTAIRSKVVHLEQLENLISDIVSKDIDLKSELISNLIMQIFSQRNDEFRCDHYFKRMKLSGHNILASTLLEYREMSRRLSIGAADDKQAENVSMMMSYMKSMHRFL